MTRGIGRLAGAAGMIAALLSASAGAAAQSKDKPRFLTPPPNEVGDAAWPAAAKAAGVGGRAAVVCTLTAAGALSDCRVAHEYPSAQGFGAALLSLIPRYQVDLAARPKDVEIGGPVVLEQDWYPQDKHADWLRKPSATDFIAVYPIQAMKDGVSGSAMLSCVVTLQGVLFDCIAYDETPKGAHFADAALALTPQFLMKPAMFKGQPVLSVVRIPINFKTEGRATAFDIGRKVASAAMVWEAAPTYAEVVDAYPAKARAAKVGGRATLNCRFTSGGDLSHCETVAQEPRGYDFGAAALKLAAHFHAYPKTADGKPLSDVGLQLPITFDPSLLDGGKLAIGKPEWAAVPGPDEVKAAFAKVPKGSGTVRVVLGCSVEQGGKVRDCAVESETPAGLGAGPAAVALSASFRLNTWTMDGLPVVGGTVRIPLRYEPEPEPPPAKP